MSATRFAAIALAALILGPAFVLLVWGLVLSSRKTYQDFICWRRAVRRQRLPRIA